MANQIVSVSKKGRVGSITISGFITTEKNTAAQISEAIDALEPECDSIDVKLLNCYGGVVYEGLGIRSRMKECSIPVNTTAEGLVASMGTVIFCAGTKRKMGKSSRLLFHRPTTSTGGDADALKDSAKELEGLEQELCDCYAEDLGMEPQMVRDTFLVRGKDTILDCAGAKKHKIIENSDVIESVFKSPVPLNVVMQSDPKAIYNFYDQQLKNQNTKMENIAKFVAALKIKNGSDATEELILKEVEATVAKISELEQKLQTAEAKIAEQQKQAITTLVEGAVKSGKILETQKATYTELATSNFESTQKALDAMTPHESITSKLNALKPGEDTSKASWTFDDYRKKDPKALAKMQKEDPKQFEALKKAKLESRG